MPVTFPWFPTYSWLLNCLFFVFVFHKNLFSPPTFKYELYLRAMQSYYKAVPRTSNWQSINAFSTMGSCQHINIGYFQQTTDLFKHFFYIFSLNVKVYRIEILCTAVTIWAVKSTRLIFYKAAALQMTYSLPEMGIFRQASCRQLHFPRFQNFFFFKRQHRFSFIQHRSVSTFSWHGGLRFSSDSIRELNPKGIKRVQSFFSSADGCRFCESQQRWYTRFNATALIFAKPPPVVSDMYTLLAVMISFLFSRSR